MKARSKKFLGAAVLAAAMAAYATPVAHAVPAIIYELSAASSTVTSGAAGSVSFDVLGLVTGSNLSQTGLVGSEFSLVQTASGITGTLDFNLSSAYNEQGNSSSHTAFFGSVPGVGGNGNQGSAAGNVGLAASTGAANDTIIGYTGISGSSVSSTAPTPVGTQVIGGTTYNVFDLGTGHFNYGSQTPASGSTVSVAVVPRIGLGNLIKPQVAIINGAVAAFAGNDTANVSSTPLTITVGGPSFILGDFNGDGGFDGTDVDNFVAALTEGDPYSSFISANDSAFFTTYGQHLTVAAINFIGDFNGDGGFDGTDVDGFIAALTNGATLEPALAAKLSAVVPEPTMGALVLIPAYLMGRRRRSR